MTAYAAIACRVKSSPYPRHVLELTVPVRTAEVAEIDDACERAGRSVGEKIVRDQIVVNDREVVGRDPDRVVFDEGPLQEAL